MSVINIESAEDTVYVILGIDENGHDRVLGVCYDYLDAKRYLTTCLCAEDLYDVWMEKHSIF